MQMNINRILVLILVVTMVIGLFVGCNSGEGTTSGFSGDSKPTGSQTTGSTNSGTQATEPTSTGSQPTEPTSSGTQPTEPSTTGTQPTEPPTIGTQPTEPTTTGPLPYDEATFFSESVFIGDSVTKGLGTYNNVNGDPLHGAKVFGVDLYSVFSAVSEIGAPNTVSLVYRGEKIRLEDLLAALGTKRVFIMLGLNEIGVDGGVNWTINNWGKLIKNIRAKCPDIEIFIQSATPVWIGGERYGLTNPRIDEYNERLEQFCLDNDCYFVNIAEVLKDDQGGLKTEYCSDKYIHLTKAGNEAWIAYLKAFVEENYNP